MVKCPLVTPTDHLPAAGPLTRLTPVSHSVHSLHAWEAPCLNWDPAQYLLSLSLGVLLRCSSLFPTALSLSSPGVGGPTRCSPLVSLQMAEQLMTLAYDNGINLFDTAEVYAAGK